MTQTLLITGANRGLGLEFTKQYLQKRWRVHACCRQPENATELAALKSLGDLTIHQLDVTNEKHIHALQAALADEPLDILINNAGTAGEPGQTIGHFSLDNIKQVFAINAFSPVVMCDVFLNNIRRGSTKTIVNITSRMGSIADNDSGKSYAYRSSKAALNCLMHSMAIDLADEGIRVLLLHPGWVKTDMGGDGALITVDKSIAKMIDLIADPHTQSGEFYHYEGQQLPW